VGFRLDLDPTIARVVVIAILLFCESLLGGILVVLNQGTMPTLVQFCTILCVALLTLVTFLLTFFRTGQIPEEE